MNWTKILLTSAGYIIGTFALAVLWHVILFKTEYDTFGYFEGEPNFLLGLTSIAIQGITLSVLYPLCNLSGSAWARAIKFSALIGCFFWTSHVLAFIAKQTVVNVLAFITMESFYLVLQFGVFAVILALVHAVDSPDDQVDGA